MKLADLDSLMPLAVYVPVVYLPVIPCPDCGGDRPHISADHYCTCLACGRTVL